MSPNGCNVSTIRHDATIQVHYFHYHLTRHACKCIIILPSDYSLFATLSCWIRHSLLLYLVGGLSTLSLTRRNSSLFRISLTDRIKPVDAAQNLCSSFCVLVFVINKPTSAKVASMGDTLERRILSLVICTLAVQHPYDIIVILLANSR